MRILLIEFYSSPIYILIFLTNKLTAPYKINIPAKEIGSHMPRLYLQKLLKVDHAENHEYPHSCYAVIIDDKSHGC